MTQTNKRKKLFLNKPSSNAKGQYSFADDVIVQDTFYANSLGLPNSANRADKFGDKGLYTTVKSHDLNDSIIQHRLPSGATVGSTVDDSFFKIKSLLITTRGSNNKRGVGSCRFTGWIFDNFAWQVVKGGSIGSDAKPTTLSGNQLLKVFFRTGGSGDGLISAEQQAEIKKFKFFDHQVSKVHKNSNPNFGGIYGGNIARQHKLFQNFGNLHTPDSYDGTVGGTSNIKVNLKQLLSPVYDFDIKSAFRYQKYQGDSHDGNFFKGPTSNWEHGPQVIYIVTCCQGDRINRRSTTKRDDTWQIFEIMVDDFFNSDGRGKRLIKNYTYSNSFKAFSSGGDKHMSAFQVKELEIEINTKTAPPVTFEEGELDSSVISLLPKVRTGEEINTEDFMLSFLQTQHPRNEILNFLDENISGIYKDDNGVNSDPPWGATKGYKLDITTRDFTPVAHTRIKGNPDYDLQAYQQTDADRQICSAPNQISLSFQLNKPKVTDSMLWDNESKNVLGNYYTKDYNGVKFFVVSWNDVNNDFGRDVEDWLDNFPITRKDLAKQQNKNLYKLANFNQEVIHSYSTPGIKVIKAIVFSHTQNLSKITFDRGVTQALRWKFVTIRMFLDIPINDYPDFEEFGQNTYVALPWPNTSPIIGGTSPDSNYMKSIDSVLRGGNISDTEIIDELFLSKAQQNDEMGESIESFDFGQLRYFNSGYNSIYKFLNFEVDHDNTFIKYSDISGSSTFTTNNSNYWDGENHIFPEESSIEQIFIDDISDIELKNECQIEINGDRMQNKVISDSSGNVNKGLVFGDYKVRKNQKGEPITKEATIQMPTKEIKDGAI